jgi:hypothetical protein
VPGIGAQQPDLRARAPSDLAAPVLLWIVAPIPSPLHSGPYLSIEVDHSVLTNRFRVRNHATDEVLGGTSHLGHGILISPRRSAFGFGRVLDLLLQSSARGDSRYSVHAGFDVYRRTLPSQKCDHGGAQDNTTFPRVLISNETTALIITARTPRQLPFRAPGINEKHPSVVPIAVREDMTLPSLLSTRVQSSHAPVR